MNQSFSLWSLDRSTFTSTTAEFSDVRVALQTAKKATIFCRCAETTIGLHSRLLERQSTFCDPARSPVPLLLCVQQTFRKRLIGGSLVTSIRFARAGYFTMSFGGSVPKEQFKSFVTETEIEEKRKVRQQEWEKVRKPDEPLEAPEVPVDNRTLYDRLQAKKALEQEEKDEAKKMKNFVRGLEHDEVEFLDQIDDIYTKMERDKIAEERAALREFKEKSAILQSTSISSIAPTTSVTGKRKEPPGGSLTTDLPKKKSQKELLASAVRLKRPNSTDESKEETASSEVLLKDGSDPTQAEPDNKQLPAPKKPATSISGYGSSSDSE